MTTTAPEYLATLRDGVAEAVQQWLDQSSTAWDQWSRAWTPTDAAMGWWVPGSTGGPEKARAGQGATKGRHDHGCDCHQGHRQDHGPDHEHGCGGGQEGCHAHDHGAARPQRCGGGCGDPCRCCVPDADVVIHARVGEVRVVPFHLRNAWRRERPVSLEVGPWHGCDGDGLTVRALLEEESIVLAPCEDRVVRLLVAVRPSSTDGQNDGADAGSTDGQNAGSTYGQNAGHSANLGRIGGDVEGCATAYADVRFEGCARPQRVAVVVLPAECDAVDVGCDCGCCC